MRTAQQKIDYLRAAAQFCERHGPFHMRWRDDFEEIGSWMQPEIPGCTEGDVVTVETMTRDEQALFLCLAASVLETESLREGTEI